MHSKNIQLLDCTLRDGGHVNSANFGENVIREIIRSLVKANIDIIELGFLKNGSFNKDTTNFNKISEAYDYLPDSGSSEFSLMIRPDWYDINKLEPCNGKIKFLRLAFYYRDIELTKKTAIRAKELGYKIFLNPVNIVGYSKLELNALMHDIIELSPDALTIVDTFGSLTQKKIIEIYDFIELELPSNIIIDLHLHENQSLCLALAQKFLDIKEKARNVCIDASLYGMGKVPGNLPIESIADYLNSYDNCCAYNLESILYAISKYIVPLKEKYQWGYSPAYYFTGKLGIHRTYAEYLLDKSGLTLDQIYIILHQIAHVTDKFIFDKGLAENIYQDYIALNKLEKDIKT